MNQTNHQIEKLRQAFSEIETISIEKSNELIEIMNKLPKSDLKILAKANIKFVSNLAQNRLSRKQCS